MILQITFAALAIIFIHSWFMDGMILGSFADRMESKLPQWIIKPLFGCIICMSPWYGTALYFAYPWMPGIIVFLFCLGGGMVVIDIILGYLRHESGLSK